MGVCFFTNVYLTSPVDHLNPYSKLDFKMKYRTNQTSGGKPLRRPNPFTVGSFLLFHCNREFLTLSLIFAA